MICANNDSKGNMNCSDERILVAINCIAYNHEPYIRECLEGFVMQKTNFKFVAIVHDDASTDKTADIIREYEAKYPEIIKPIYETENQYSKKDGSLRRIMNAAIDATGAKYVALCEGDDYWTDPYKLQKQVDFLEGHEECVLCYTDCDIFYEDFNSWEKSVFANGYDRMNAKTILEPRIGWYCSNMTWVYRAEIFKQIPNNPGFIDGALYLLYSMCLLGDLGFVEGSTGVYRRHLGSASCIKHDGERQYKYNKSCFFLSLYFIPKFDNCIENYKRVFSTNLFSLYVEAMKRSDRETIECFKSFYKDTLDIDMICRQFIACYSAKNSHAYRLGKFILRPFNWVKRKIKGIK